MTDFSYEAAAIRDEVCRAAMTWAEAGVAQMAPHVLYKPALAPDGDQWCALYGDNLQEGVAGFGDTPAAAMAAFDKAWLTERTPTAVRLARVSA